MKIEIWSDFVCPFCYLGKRHLEYALNQLQLIDKVEIEYRSFELAPNQKPYDGTSIHNLLANKYGMSLAEAKKANERVGEAAMKVGLKYNFDEMKYTNTFDAHRLAKYAKTFGKEKEIVEKIMEGYFINSLLISDYETLADFAMSVGLDRNEVIKVLEDKRSYEDEVRYDENLANKLGINGVPYIRINEKYVISGAHPINVFVEKIKLAWDNELEA